MKKAIIILLLIVSKISYAQPFTKGFSDGTVPDKRHTFFKTTSTPNSRIIEYVRVHVMYQPPTSDPNKNLDPLNTEDPGDPHFKDGQLLFTIPGDNNIFKLVIPITAGEPLNSYFEEKNLNWYLPPNKIFKINAGNFDADIEVYISGFEYKPQIQQQAK